MNNELLQQLATKLGTTVDHLWSVLLAQAKLEVTFIIANICIMAASLIFCTFLLFKTKKYDPSMILLSTIWIACLVVIIALARQLMILEINPEYWALQQILGNLRQ